VPLAVRWAGALRSLRLSGEHPRPPQGRDALPSQACPNRSRRMPALRERNGSNNHGQSGDRLQMRRVHRQLKDKFASEPPLPLSAATAEAGVGGDKS
jgi:hypothetical protein